MAESRNKYFIYISVNENIKQKKMLTTQGIETDKLLRYHLILNIDETKFKIEFDEKHLFT